MLFSPLCFDCKTNAAPPARQPATWVHMATILPRRGKETHDAKRPIAPFYALPHPTHSVASPEQETELEEQGNDYCGKKQAHLLISKRRTPIQSVHPSVRPFCLNRFQRRCVDCFLRQVCGRRGSYEKGWKSPRALAALLDSTRLNSARIRVFPLLIHSCMLHPLLAPLGLLLNDAQLTPRTPATPHVAAAAGIAAGGARRVVCGAAAALPRLLHLLRHGGGCVGGVRAGVRVGGGVDVCAGEDG
ncbi:uncharacterized protein J3D65DRAFT_200238 [Phyllosticta citribraziliensis]|uniref:Uncharacterized protein n=1 Tax=Phyllosticta citribraziliensis TaxID=989973 RepID=A0ABR1M4Y5_9PEZI